MMVENTAVDDWHSNLVPYIDTFIFDHLSGLYFCRM